MDAFTGSFASVATAGQQTALTGVLTSVLQLVMNWVYTTFTMLLTFLTSPYVLGALITLGLIYIGVRWVRRKTAGL